MDLLEVGKKKFTTQQNDSFFQIHSCELIYYFFFSFRMHFRCKFVHFYSSFLWSIEASDQVLGKKNIPTIGVYLFNIFQIKYFLMFEIALII